MQKLLLLQIFKNLLSSSIKNLQLENLIKQQILDKLLIKVVDIFILAHIIIYFNIIQNQATSYSNIIKYFKD